MSKKSRAKTIFRLCLDILSLTKRTRFGAGLLIRGSDPKPDSLVMVADPYQNVTDPEHRFLTLIYTQFLI
jgi:hypothetical protein